MSLRLASRGATAASGWKNRTRCGGEWDGIKQPTGSRQRPVWRTVSCAGSGVSPGRMPSRPCPRSLRPNLRMAAASQEIDFTGIDFEPLDEVDFFGADVANSLSEGADGEKLLVHDVAVLEKKKWLLSGQKRAEQTVEVLEDTPRHFDFLQRIAVKAQEGDVLGVEAIFEEMQFPEDDTAGLMLGPRAYHALIFAQVKSEDVTGALDTWRHAYISGIAAVPETYALLVKGIFKSGRPPAQAKVLVNSVARWHGRVAELAWRELVIGLFKAGFGPDAEEEFNIGIRKRWKANHEMYAVLIEDLCSRGKEQDVERAHEWLRQMTKSGLMAVEDHIAPVIDGYLSFERSDAAVELFRVLGENGLGPTTTRVSNSILIGAGNFLLDTRALAEAFSIMRQHNAMPSESIYTTTLFSVLAANRGVLEYVNVLDAYPDILVPGGPVNDFTLSMLFTTAKKFPDSLMSFLEVLHICGRTLPEALTKPDNSGLTMVASFLEGMVVDLYEIADEAEEEADTVSYKEVEIREMEGMLIGVGSCIVDEEGNVKAPSKLSVEELRVELRARGLSDEGKRADLYKRVQAARRSAPQEMEEQARRRAMQRKEEKKLEIEQQRAEAATNYLNHPLEWRYFKADKFGDFHCFLVEDKSILDMEKEYFLTAQTRRIWGIPRANVSIGQVTEVDWEEMPDPYVPPGMSAVEVSELMWQHAKADGLTPSFYRTLLDVDSEVPLPKEVAARTRVEINEDGIEEIVDVDPEEAEVDEDDEEDGIEDGEDAEVGLQSGGSDIDLDMRQCVSKAKAIAEAAEDYFGLLPSEADVDLIARVVQRGGQVADVPAVVEMLERHGSRFDIGAVGKMYEGLVRTCLAKDDVNLADTTFRSMVNAGVPKDAARDTLELSIQGAER